MTIEIKIGSELVTRDVPADTWEGQKAWLVERGMDEAVVDQFAVIALLRVLDDAMRRWLTHGVERAKPADLVEKEAALKAAQARALGDPAPEKSPALRMAAMRPE